MVLFLCHDGVRLGVAVVFVVVVIRDDLVQTQSKQVRVKGRVFSRATRVLRVEIDTRTVVATHGGLQRKTSVWRRGSR